MWNPMSSVCFCIVKENVLKNKIKKKKKEKEHMSFYRNHDVREWSHFKQNVLKLYNAKTALFTGW